MCLLGCWWEDREDPTIWRATEEEVLGAWWEQGTAAASPRRPVLPRQRDQYGGSDDRTRSGWGYPFGRRDRSSNATKMAGSWNVVKGKRGTADGLQEDEE